MKTTVDYWKFRTRSDPFFLLDALRPCFGTTADLVDLGEPMKGKDGWEHRRHLMMAGDIKIGAVDYGGDHQRGWVRVDISGEGCGWVQDWKTASDLVFSLKEATIKRVDLALTTYDGSVSHDLVIAAHDNLEFGSGGRHPHRRVVTSSDLRAGRTIYVGSRDSCKFFRAYEKGLEILQKHVPKDIRDRVNQIEFDHHGFADVESVYRVEVEFKDSDDKVIPWDILINGDSYFSGAYPFCASLIPGAPQRKVSGIPDFWPKVALLSQLEHARRAYGGIIRAALIAFDGDRDRVLDMLMSDRPSDKLISAGVLTVVHD
jgi:DNA relaxase NicK